MYADFNHYVEKYLMGKKELIPKNDFKYYERQAEREIDYLTFNRFKEHPNCINESVKDCACEVAEHLYRMDKANSNINEGGLPGPLSSYSNDGESGSYDLTNYHQLYSESGSKAKIQSIIGKYLVRTGAMYRGFYENE